MMKVDNAYVITTLDQPPSPLNSMFIVRIPEDGVTRYDYATESIADAAKIKNALVACGISGALKPPSNTRSTMARAITF